MVGRRFRTILVLALLFGARRAWASPSARLVYVRSAGAEACPAEAELRRAVAARLGYDPFFPAATKTVVAQVARHEKGYRGKVQIVGDDGNVRGERDLASKGDDCAELVNAMALGVSIALDDLDDLQPATPPAASDSGASEPPLPPRPPAPPPPASERAAPTAQAPPPPRRTRVDLAVGLGPAISIGSAPRAAGGVSVAATLRFGWAGVRLDLRGDLPASAPFFTTGVVTTTTLLATLTGCARVGIAFVCAGGGAGRIASETEGIAHGASDAAPLAVAGGRTGVHLALGERFYVEPNAEAFANLVRHRVEADGVVVYHAAVGAGTVAVHFGAHFL